MRLIALLTLPIILLGARHETPVLQIDRPNSDITCQYQYDHGKPSIAADKCLIAADDWAHYGAIHQRDANDDLYSLAQILTRVEAAKSLYRSGNSTVAFIQLSLAFDQSISVDKTTKYDIIHQRCVVAAKRILNLVTSMSNKEKI